MERRLAAILVADVVGYSRLMEDDEVGTLAALQERRSSVLDPIIRDHAGRIVKVMGDGVLIEFASAVNAVTAALALQRGMSEPNAALAKNRRIVMRIGINLGDVIGTGRDIYGDSVNIAARLETLAEPGGICISAKVHEEVSGKVDCAFEDMGAQSVKNISRKVRAYRVRPSDKDVASLPTTDLSLPDKPSIAVLPFENMSADADQEYFSDGITEDIITALSRSPWLFIIARNTTFTYKGKNVDVKQVASDLGVRYVLEGSVRRAGDRIRVTAQLIDGLTGGHVWSERYDGQLADVFDLQDEITQKVVASIQTRVHLTASEPAGKQPRPDLTVWELTMRAWHLLYDFTLESFVAAKPLLERALARDPDSAEANLVLSLILHHTTLMGHTDDHLATMTTAYELARRATRLDDRNEYAQWALGVSCFGLLRYDESIAALERAVELNPNCSVAHGSLGTALALVGSAEEAIANQEIAIRSNPRDPSIFFRFSGMALAHYLAGRYEIAAEWAGKAIHLAPQWYFGHFIRIASLVRSDRQDEAKAAVAGCNEVLPSANLSLLERMPLKNPAEMQRLRDCLRQAGLSD